MAFNEETQSAKLEIIYVSLLVRVFEPNDALKISRCFYKSYGYNFENDSNVQGNIFSDGKQFCLQVSSWRTKTKAQREASKIRAKSSNVFIMPFTNNQTNLNWFRVRLGTFESVTETEQYLSLLEN